MGFSFFNLKTSNKKVNTLLPNQMDDEYLKIIRGEICPYCNCETKLVTGEIIYPHITEEKTRPKYLDKSFYLCVENNDHYVGTYSDNKTSLGRVADKKLRNYKNLGHRTFDPLWKEKTHFNSQKEAYDWLSEKMKLPLEFTHFGMFTIEQCKVAINFCESLVEKKKNKKFFWSFWR